MPSLFMCVLVTSLFSNSIRPISPRPFSYSLYCTSWHNSGGILWKTPLNAPLTTDLRPDAMLLIFCTWYSPPAVCFRCLEANMFHVLGFRKCCYAPVFI
jgi:hypothetical protein